MALWHFECNIIPNRNKMDGLTEDEKKSWVDFNLAKADIGFLKREKSWSDDIVRFGTTDRTNIEFSYEDGMLDEIVCRLDLRSLTKKELDMLIEYVKVNNALFLVDDKACLPEKDVLVAVMEKSDANRFCLNPREYMNEHIV